MSAARAAASATRFNVFFIILSPADAFDVRVNSCERAADIRAASFQFVQGAGCKDGAQRAGADGGTRENTDAFRLSLLS
jgi:hypothetical protein